MVCELLRATKLKFNEVVHMKNKKSPCEKVSVGYLTHLVVATIGRFFFFFFYCFGSKEIVKFLIT